MLAPGSFQTPFAGGLVEAECPRCGTEGELPFGSICGGCKRQIKRRATRIARWASLLSTALLGLYVYLQASEEPVARVVGGVSVALWYVFSYAMVKRGALLLLK